MSFMMTENSVRRTVIAVLAALLAGVLVAGCSTSTRSSNSGAASPRNTSTRDQSTHGSRAAAHSPIRRSMTSDRISFVQALRSCAALRCPILMEASRVSSWSVWTKKPCSRVDLRLLM